MQELSDSRATFVNDKLSTLIHEISHKIGAPDHYHEGILEYDGDNPIPCVNSPLCSDCGNGDPKQRAEDCIMCDCWGPVRYCDDCYADITNELVRQSLYPD